MVSKQVKVKVSYNIIETSNFDQKTCSRSCVASLAIGTFINSAGSQAQEAALHRLSSFSVVLYYSKDFES